MRELPGTATSCERSPASVRVVGVAQASERWSWPFAPPPSGIANASETSETILAARDRFPEAGRTKIRKNFPVDYLWAVTSAPERLAGIIDDQVKHYDQVDR